jgi:hypothetical protein
MNDEAKAMLASLLGVDPGNLPLTLDVVTAGRAAGQRSKARAYAAVKDGSLPVIEIAGRMRVPTLALLKKLSGEATHQS